jgi:hypothetical protein
MTELYRRLMRCMTKVPSRERDMFWLGATLHSAMETQEHMRAGRAVTGEARANLELFRTSANRLGFGWLLGDSPTSAPQVEEKALPQLELQPALLHALRPE